MEFGRGRKHNFETLKTGELKKSFIFIKILLQHCCNKLNLCIFAKKRNMKTQVTLFILLLSTMMFSQQKFTGKVVDLKTNEAISNTTIYAFNLNKSVTTNMVGNFVIIGNSTKKLQVEVSHLGFKTKVITLLENTENVIALDNNLLEIDEIIVTGGGGGKSREKISYAIETISKDELYKSGQLSLAANLSKIPGVNNSSNGVAATKPVIRGLSNTNIVFLNNGIKAENFQFSSNHPFIADEFSAKKIEVIKGPVSLIYGSDAVGGVINVIKENAAPVNTIQASINSQYHSNTEGFVNNISVKIGGEKWYGGASFTRKSDKDYKDGNGKQIINTRFEELNLGTTIGYRSKLGNFTLSHDFAMPKYGVTNPKSVVFIKNNDREIEYWYQSLDNHLIASKNKFYIGKNTLDADFAYQENKRIGLSDTSNPNPEMIFAEMQLQTISYNFKYTFNTDNNILYVGFNGANINNDANDFYKNSNPMPDAKINDLGFFVINEHNLSEKLNLNAGIRYDIRTMQSFPYTGSGLSKYTVDLNYGNFSGSVGTTYKLEKQTFKLNIAKGYRSPNISELTQNGIHQNRFERGDITLKPQNNYQLDFNYHLHTNNLVFDVSPFYNMIDKYIFIVQTTAVAPIGGGKIWQYLQADANIYGGEASLDYHPLSWAGIHTNYTYTRGELKQGGFLTEIPQNRLVAELKLEKDITSFFKNSYLLFNYTSYQSQNELGYSETYTPSYELFNMSIGATLQIKKQDFNWYISGNNLLDKAYIDHLSLLKPMNLNNIGRNIVFGLNIPISAKL